MEKAAAALFVAVRGRGAVLLTRRRLPLETPSILKHSFCSYPEKWRGIPVCSTLPAPLPRCNFHSGTAVAAPRRRRGGGGASLGSDPERDAAESDGYDRGGSRPTPVDNREVFSAAAAAFLDRVEAALKPMEAFNDFFEVRRAPKVSDVVGAKLSVHLAAGEGTYTLQVDEENQNMTLTSPMSGAYTYVLCNKTKEFRGMDDGHILEGMLTRDLIRQCNGVPDF